MIVGEQLVAVTRMTASHAGRTTFRKLHSQTLVWCREASDILQWPGQEWDPWKTRGPSFPLRSGRDDKIISGIGTAH
jgi:hypothetical protein